MTRDEVLRMLPPVAGAVTFSFGSGYILSYPVELAPDIYIFVRVPFRHSDEVLSGGSVSVDALNAIDADNGTDRTALVPIESRYVSRPFPAPP